MPRCAKKKRPKSDGIFWIDNVAYASASPITYHTLESAYRRTQWVSDWLENNRPYVTTGLEQQQGPNSETSVQGQQEQTLAPLGPSVSDVSFASTVFCFSPIRRF